MKNKEEYKVSRKCKKCGQVDDYYFTKRDAAFWRYGDIYEKKCLQCGSLEFKSINYPWVEVDEELMEEWSVNEGLYFLSQDEEISLGEKKYIDLIFRFLDKQDILSSKKMVLVESLYVIIYNILEGVAEEEIEKIKEEKEEDTKVLQKLREFLLKRKFLLKECNDYALEYLKEVVYPFLGIQFEMMKIKVCGMKNPENIQQLAQLPIDFMGLIFYSKSPRYVAELNPEHLSNLPSHIKKVGVFVNAELQEVENRVKEYSLDYVQLHGKETIEYIKELRIKIPNLRIIKAFSIAEIQDIEKTEEYEEVCDYLLFDTKTPQHGGSGKKFDWTILNSYQGETPFFLSGGISAEDTEEIQKIQHKKLYALDLNSKFELEPGLKDIKQLDKFLTKIKKE